MLVALQGMRCGPHSPQGANGAPGVSLQQQQQQQLAGGQAVSTRRYIKEVQSALSGIGASNLAALPEAAGTIVQVCWCFG